MGSIKELKYKIKEIMIEKDEPEDEIDTFTKQLNEEVARLDVVLASLENKGKAAIRSRSERRISKKNGTREAVRRDGVLDKKALGDKKKIGKQKNHQTLSCPN